jgi:hypothetical protein
MGRRQQFLHEPFVSLGRSIPLELSDLVGRGRQAKEIKE